MKQKTPRCAGRFVRKGLFLLFPDGVLEHPAAIFVLIEDVTVVKAVHDVPELGLRIAAELAEIAHA